MVDLLSGLQLKMMLIACMHGTWLVLISFLPIMRIEQPYKWCVPLVFVHCTFYLYYYCVYTRMPCLACFVYVSILCACMCKIMMFVYGCVCVCLFVSICAHMCVCLQACAV